MNDFLRQIHNMILSRQMLAAGERVLVAVSGGADSVCLLLALKELGYEVHAVHVEHGIRGQESLEDERFVRGLCDELALPLLSFSVDAPGCAGENGLSFIQCACRITERNAAGDGMAGSKREEIKRMIASMKEYNPHVDTNIFNSVHNINLANIIGYHKGDMAYNFLDDYTLLPGCQKPAGEAGAAGDTCDAGDAYDTDDAGNRAAGAAADAGKRAAAGQTAYNDPADYIFEYID